MLAVFAPIDQVESALTRRFRPGDREQERPGQAVLSGPAEEITRAMRWFGDEQVDDAPLAVSAAFHSRFVADASGPFGEALAEVALEPARLPVYSNTTADRYPEDPDEARALLAGQLARPVEFEAQIEAMHQSGSERFSKSGRIRNSPASSARSWAIGAHVALAVDASNGRRGNVADLAHALAQLAALGYPVLLRRWDEGVDAQISPAPKPGLTVKVCGANPTPRRAPIHNADSTFTTQPNRRSPKP